MVVEFEAGHWRTKFCRRQCHKVWRRAWRSGHGFPIHYWIAAVLFFWRKAVARRSCRALGFLLLRSDECAVGYVKRFLEILAEKSFLCFVAFGSFMTSPHFSFLVSTSVTAMTSALNSCNELLLCAYHRLHYFFDEYSLKGNVVVQCSLNRLSPMIAKSMAVVAARSVRPKLWQRSFFASSTDHTQLLATADIHELPSPDGDDNQMYQLV